MTRGDALRKISEAIDRMHKKGIRGRESDFLAILEALGLVKIEDGPQTIGLPCIGYNVDSSFSPAMGPGFATVYVKTAIENLEMMGYAITAGALEPKGGK